MKHQTNLRLMTSALILMFAFMQLSCGTLAGNPGTNSSGGSVDKQSIVLPNATPIILSPEEDQANLLADISVCSDEANLGVFGFVYGAVCSTNDLILNLLYGNKADFDDDGTVTCADYQEGGDNNGILFSLLCSDGLIANSNLKSLRFPEDDGELAIGFEDFDDLDDIEAKGSWSASGAESERYPANISIWSSDGIDTLTGALAMNLSSVDSGKLFLNFAPFGTELTGELSYGVPLGTTNPCASTPTLFNCYWQEAKMKGSETLENLSGPSGIHLRVLADDRDNPSFYFIEAKIRYSQEIAESVFDESKEGVPANFSQVREIYVRSIQKNGELWGYFDFRGEDGNSISSPITGSDQDLIDLLKSRTGEPEAGICQKIGSDSWVECEEVDFRDFETLWEDDDQFESVDVDYILPFTFPDVPPEGVQFAK